MEAKTLTDALLTARREMPDPRLSGDNPHFRSKFVPRDEVIDAVVPLLLANGVFLTQGIVGEQFVTTVYGHGESMLLGAVPVPDITDPQKLLAWETYQSRGSLMQAFCLAGEPDDDGNTAAEPEKDDAFGRLMASALENGTKVKVAERLGTPKTLADARKAYMKASAAEKKVLAAIAAGAEVKE